MKLSKRSDYRWPVELRVPADGGKYNTERFDVYFKRMSQTETDKLIERIREGGVTDREVVQSVVTGWEEVKDAEGNPLAFSDEALDLLLDVPGAGLTILRTFFDSVAGGVRKN